MSKPKSKGEPGDKVFVGGSESDRKVLISDIIECIQQKAAKTLLITISDLSEFLSKQPALSPSNLFRKQYGNLEHVFSYEALHLQDIFHVENSVIRLASIEKLESAAKANRLPADLLEKLREMHIFKRKHDLQVMKNGGKNECKNCHQSYSVLANEAANCSKNPGQNHVPSFDFEKNPQDLLACQI